jgi:hypothetical protein
LDKSTLWTGPLIIVLPFSVNDIMFLGQCFWPLIMSCLWIGPLVILVPILCGFSWQGLSTCNLLL